MPTHPIIAGIDLGTTNSAIAVVVDGELSVIPVHGELTMPSAVGLDPAGRLIIGRAAKNQEISAPENTILSIKRHMGTGHASTLGGKSYSPEEISALILGELKREAEKNLGQPVRQAVITVPAFFNEQQRKATQTAGQLAGLEVLRIINEPTAAALAYGAGTGGSDGPQTMLVYDLGGGTFDVSLVQVDQGIVEVKASHGDTQLGGDDFDNLLADLAAKRFAAQEGAGPLPDAALRRLKGVMERGKIQLSEDPFVTVNEEYLDTSRHLVTEVARTDYEELITPLLEKTLDCMQRALHDGGVTAREVDRIMLVGGATRTPLVHQLITRRMGREPRHEINPDLIVAMGAAIQGAALSGQPAPAILIDITAHTFRAEVLADMTLVCLPLIPRGTPLPVRRAESYTTAMDDQEQVRVKVFQGESLYSDGNTLLGEINVTGLSRKPAGNPIVVQFQLDLNGLLNVTATEKLTGLAKTITIDTRGQHRLNLDAARANLDALFADQREEGEESDVSDEDEDSGEYEDDEADVEEEADAGGPAEIEAGTATAADADTPAPPGLVASARSLRQRAEALLATGLPDKDSCDIRRLLSDATIALKARQWSTLQRHADSLSDIIFYLED